LERKGVLVTCAENGEQGVNRFVASRLHFFDVILMDIRMPVMDGLTATEKIRSLDREDAKTVPVIAMTANAYQEDRKRSKDAGMDAHLAKPIEPEILYATLCDKIQNGR
jgi:CheY-like chemotaxis protein